MNLLCLLQQPIQLIKSYFSHKRISQRKNIDSKKKEKDLDKCGIIYMKNTIVNLVDSVQV